MASGSVRRVAPVASATKTRIPGPAIALGLMACGPDEGARGLDTQLHDSAGIRIVENARPPEGSRLAWRIGPEPSLSIGVLEGDEPHMLFAVRDATRLADGRIVVANGGSAELRFFDSNGSHLGTRGGRGEGPGEFRELGNVAPWPGDSLVAWFAPGWRISVFDGDGNYGRTFGINDGTRPWRFRPDSPTRDGLFLAVLAPEDADTLVLELRDDEGGVRSSLGTHPGAEPYLMHEGTGREMLYWKVFGREPVWGVWGDLVAVGVSSRYEIKALEADGSLVRIVRREHIPREVTSAVVDAHIEGRRFFNEANRREYRSVPVAEHFPVFTSIMSDGLDHLWVREYDLPGEERGAPLWSVFDPEGRVLGFVETPAALTIYEIGPDYILGKLVSELGVESVQVWPLDRSGG